MKVLFAVFLLLARSTVLRAQFQDVLINCGGGEYTDVQGRVWQADSFFNGGKTYSDTAAAIADTADDELYQSERYGRNKDLSYSIPLPTGDYQVLLHMAEIFFNAEGQRIFGVEVEGTIQSNVDLVQLGAGEANKAIIMNFPTLVEDGVLDIKLIYNGVQNPKISAIEVTSVSTPIASPVATPVASPVGTTSPPTISPIAPPPTAPTTPFEHILINCGGGEYTDVEGRVWQADSFFNGGKTYTDTTATIADTADDELYQSERYGRNKDLSYSIPLPTGDYQVLLHMAEIFFNAAGQRIFDVEVEGTIQSNVDLVQLGAGEANKAIIMNFPTLVEDGILDIRLIYNGVQNPKISAIEVTPPVPTFEDILINCGGVGYTDVVGRVWQADTFFIGGNTFGVGTAIANTPDDFLYQSERFGDFTYSIPIPVGNYQVLLHMAEIYHTLPGKRIFDVVLEDVTVQPTNIDLVELSGGPFTAIILDFVALVEDGFLDISLINTVDNPKISAIEVTLIEPHLAHSVPGADGYIAFDSDCNGFEDVPVDGSQSHTHSPGQVLTDFIWKKGAQLLSTEEVTTLNLPVGVHDVSLLVIDSQGNEDTFSTEVIVRPCGWPRIDALSPFEGSTSGGDEVTIMGSGFLTVTSVQFGLIELSGNEINIVDDQTITVFSPSVGIAVPVEVYVTATSAEGEIQPSNSKTFNYQGGPPIEFEIAWLTDFDSPTTVAFGPDGKLYAGNRIGQIGKFTLNEDYTGVVSQVIAQIVNSERDVMGIAFDPLEKYGTENPTVYFSSSGFFHNQTLNSVGDAINGKIHKATGANLDNVVDIVTGLPVSETDHGVNGIYFGNNGEIYVQVGSNTNGGIPGSTSQSQLQRENYFSAATLIVNYGKAGFNGDITYDAVEDGNPITGYGPLGVEVFAAGNRNPYDVVLHSNGLLYGTDNGPNRGYGDMATGCEPGQQIPDKYRKDKLNLLERGNWYGHPNFKRGETDPRQCVWRDALESSDANYTAPLMILDPSTDGICEFRSDHFDGQMRGNLILSKYKSGLRRVILTPDGLGVEPLSDPAIVIGGNNGLDVTQAPNGNLIDARLTKGNLFYYKPIEPASSSLEVKAVFPFRGGLDGGGKIMIFGDSFAAGATVQMGGNSCTNVSVLSAKKIECTIPAGSLGDVDVSVTSSGTTKTFLKGYRYITGQPE